MTRLRIASAIGCLALLTVGATAEAPEDGKGRYAMTPVEGGFLRLDKDAGNVSLCARKADRWMCDPVEDRAKTSDDRVAKLESENQSLKDRVKSLEDSLATGKPPAAGETPPGAPAGKLQLPSEEEVDKALDFVERIFKKFRNRVERIEKPEPPKAEGHGGAL